MELSDDVMKRERRSTSTCSCSEAMAHGSSGATRACSAVLRVCIVRYDYIVCESNYVIRFLVVYRDARA